MKRIAIISIIIGICLIITGVIIEINKTENNHNQAKNIAKENNVVDKNDVIKAQFNDFVKSKFSSKYFKVNELETKNIYSNSDFKVEYKLKGKQGSFYLKNLWIKKYDNKTIQIANETEIQLIKKYIQTMEEPAFRIVGVGGNPNSPKLIFAVPFEAIEKNDIGVNIIDKFKKEKVETNFFYDLENKILK